MSDGGRSAARGFLYQYVRTIEALLDVVDIDSVRAIYVEGQGVGIAGGSVESVDYELVDHAGATVAAVQVKGRGPGGLLGPSDVFLALSGLARGRDALRYELITNAGLRESARTLAGVLRSEIPPEELRRQISRILSAAGASRARAELDRSDDDELSRLSRAVVIVDQREDAEVHATLKARLRKYRNNHRKGLGDVCAGFMAGYLISEIFAGAADESRAEITITGFRSRLMADSSTLRAAVSRRDWGVVVGPVPGWPDVYRGGLIEQISVGLACQEEEAAVRRCLLVGLSGIGKSSLAAALILDRADIYDSIFWVDAENEATLAGSFARALAHLQGAGRADVANAAQLRDCVHDALANSASRWLMVLDNCTDMRAAERWIPRVGNGHVIVTTTDDAAPPGPAVKITVGPMADSEATALVRTRLSAGEKISAESTGLISQLVRAMERWPLALELAAGYIVAGGMGTNGIPRYLETLKMRSLGHSPAVPPGYPRTLVEAIYMCLERLESHAKRDDDPASIAASAVWFAAYLSSRRIPVHLLITAVMLDPQGAGGFRATTPCYVRPSVCPDPEVIALLRSESLVSLDEPLPAEGLSDPNLPNATISVNSVLQEVLRHRRDADPRVPEHLLGRLAYHLALWLAASHINTDHLRTLIFAGHAATVHEHAVRLGADSDYMALMRGNLAPVMQRRGDIGQAAALLRAEIAQVEGKSAEYCVLLCCQAQIMLASVLADDEPPGYAEIIMLLGRAFVVLQERAADKPTAVAGLALGIQGTLRRIIHQRWGPGGTLMHDASQLEIVVTELLARLPGTESSAALQALQDAETAFRSDDPQIAIESCQKVLDQFAGTPDVPMARQLQTQARSLLIEALVAYGDMAGASRELHAFWSATDPAELYANARERLIHNAGLVLAFKLLTSDEPRSDVSELLASMVSPGRADPIEAAFPGLTAARIRLLRAVSAITADDEPSASAYLESALPELSSADGRSGGNDAWLLVAGLAQTSLAARRKAPASQEQEPGPAASAVTGSPARAPRAADRASSHSSPSSPRHVQRLAAPGLMAQGLPGPRGTWIRRPRRGEAHAVGNLLDDAGDHLAPWTADAINNGNLSSALAGMLAGRPLEELADLIGGGPEAFMSGLTVVLVAVTPDRKLVGTVQVSPPFQLLDELGTHGVTAVQQRVGAAVIAKISGVAVASSYRRRGIGGALISSASDLCWRLGRQLVYGQIHADPQLCAFVASCGFDIYAPLTAIDLAPYGIPAGITPETGNQFFASHFDLISGENASYGPP